MRGGWNRGLTKDTNSSVKKTSETMRKRKLDNFKKWRDEAKRRGVIKSAYAPFKRNGDLAELIGVVLGDGHIGKHARCESLRITGNFSNKGFTKRYASLIEKVFGKNPAVAKVKASNATIITIYEKHISSRLGIPCGGRASLAYKLPVWIRKSRRYHIRFLRGLYEAEGSECYHAGTYTHKLLFANVNTSILVLVSELVRGLGFATTLSKKQVQVSRKEEVQNLRNLLRFRHYDS